MSSRAGVIRETAARPSGVKRNLVAAAAALSTYQIFTVAVAGTYFPLSLFACLACLIVVVFRPEDKPLLVASLAFWLAIVLSGVWSPDKGAWANGVLYQSLFFIGLFASRSFNHRTDLAKVVRIFLYAAAINAVLVIVFRLIPPLKQQYLHSDLLNVFRNPKRTANFARVHPNTFDPGKSGGVFDNANMGAAFNLMCVGAALALRDGMGRTLNMALIALFTLAVVASGSKSALAIIVAGALICFALNMFRKGRKWEFTISVLLAAVGILALPLQDILEQTQHTQLGTDTVHTSGSRAALWSLAAMLFRQHPLFGLGFGGWQPAITPYASAYGVDVSWPPHNSILSAWADTGLFGAITLGIVYGLIARSLVRALMRSHSPWRATGAIYAFVCVGAMSMGDPFPLLGSANIAFPLGCIVALGLLESRQNRARPPGSGRPL